MAETGFSEEKVLPSTDPDRLARVWRFQGGFTGWLIEDDHKEVGIRFIVTAFVFFILGGLMALVMRLQLAQPLAEVVGPDLYNQLFTMHGMTMMFFFAVPMLEGIGIYIIPLMIGARDTAFPRLNSYSYFTFLLAGVLLYVGFFIGQAPDVGWFAYTPLSGSTYSPGDRADFWALPVTMLEFSALTQAITLIVTILKCRAPGMTLSRMPILVWAFLVMSVLVVIAMPALITSSLLLELDRSFGTKFYDAAGGGDPILWQHLFWWFGHPDVYIIFLPGFGIVASILPVFTRREVLGYIYVVLAVIATGVISVTVWAHHMFAVGLPWLSLGFFAATTMAVAIPAGVQIFAWLGTVWSSRELRFEPPFLFIIGFVLIFVIGGLTGVMLAAVPFNFQVHDTHWVVAHFHYVLIGGMVFPLFGGLYYWLPKVTGRMLSRPLGIWSFWLAFLGFNLAFLPMHLSGFWGMPRRVYTYHPGLGLELPNLISTIGAFLFAGSVLLFLVNFFLSQRNGPAAGNDPWGANTLEWATSSPPPDYNFRYTPSVRSRSPLWAQPELAGPDRGWGDFDRPEEEVFIELRDDRRELLATRVRTARPDARIVSTGPSIWPFMTAVATTIAIGGLLISPWVSVLGAGLVFVTLLYWHWPEEPSHETANVPPAPRAVLERVPPERHVDLNALPDHVSGVREVTWWGMMIFIAIEVIMITLLIFSYFYIKNQHASWPLGNIDPPKLTIPIVYSLVLLASSGAFYWAQRGVWQNRERSPVWGLAAAALLAAIYLALKIYEYRHIIEYQWYENAYASLSWTLSWFHAAHVFTSILKIAAIFPLVKRGYFSADRYSGIQITGIYWHFVVIAWIPLFFTLYLSPWLS